MNKKIFITLLIGIFSFSCLFGQSQKKIGIKDVEQMLIGTWKVDTIHLKPDLDLGAYYDLYVEKFKEIKEFTVFNFEKNKTYTNKGLKGIEKKGKWRITPDGKRIIVKMNDTGKDESSKIDYISKDSLIISPLEESSNSKVVLYKYIENE
jgi:hypothetical protein